MSRYMAVNNYRIPTFGPPHKLITIYEDKELSSGSNKDLRRRLWLWYTQNGTVVHVLAKEFPRTCYKIKLCMCGNTQRQ